MIGAFGSVISLCQLLVLERTEWASGELYVSVLERGASQAGLGLSRGCHRNNAGVWALIAGFVCACSQCTTRLRCVQRCSCVAMSTVLMCVFVAV